MCWCIMCWRNFHNSKKSIIKSIFPKVPSFFSNYRDFCSNYIRFFNIVSNGSVWDKAGHFEIIEIFEFHKFESYRFHLLSNWKISPNLSYFEAPYWIPHFEINYFKYIFLNVFYILYFIFYMPIESIWRSIFLLILDIAKLFNIVIFTIFALCLNHHYNFLVHDIKILVPDYERADNLNKKAYFDILFLIFNRFYQAEFFQIDLKTVASASMG